MKEVEGVSKAQCRWPEHSGFTQPQVHGASVKDAVILSAAPVVKTFEGQTFRRACFRARSKFGGLQ
jgi:hypothetical protein